MKTTRVLAVAVLIIGGGLALDVAQSQQAGVTRTDLVRHDLSVAGREVIQVRVDFAPGVAFPPHKIAYVIEGLLEYQFEGKPPSRSRLARPCSSRPGRSTRRRMSAAATPRSSPRISSRKASRSSHSVRLARR